MKSLDIMTWGGQELGWLIGQGILSPPIGKKGKIDKLYNFQVWPIGKKGKIDKLYNFQVWRHRAHYVFYWKHEAYKRLVK
jgi:hypothetical protein